MDGPTATTSGSNRGQRFAAHSGIWHLPEAAVEVRPIADLQALVSMHAGAILSAHVSSGRLLWHQLDLQLAPNRARVPLERRQ
jgi:hypothetical protein